MRVHFWGVRGSVPTPMSSIQLRNKITAIVQRITPNDLKDEDSREKFIANLPQWLVSTVGGNTACVEIATRDNQTFLLDAGTGLREFGRLSDNPSNEFHMFFSHFHWDHIQGIPFWGNFYDKKTVLHIYSPWPFSVKILAKQMSFPYFPTLFSASAPTIHFHLMKEGVPRQVGNVKVTCIKMPHPGASYSYSFEENGKKFIYASDVELTEMDAKTKEKAQKLFSNADMLVLDAQYTIEELLRKSNWGHSNCCHDVDFARSCGVKNLYLFHHEPNYSDKDIFNLTQTARWYAESESAPQKSKISIFAACEGMDIEV